MQSTSREEIIVSNEYKHLNVLKDGKFLQGALVNSAKIEYDGQNKMRILASLEGHKIIDTNWVFIQENYSHVIVEDETSHQVKLRLSDIKAAYRMAVKEANVPNISHSDKESILRLIVIFGNFVKRSKS